MKDSIIRAEGLELGIDLLSTIVKTKHIDF